MRIKMTLGCAAVAMLIGCGDDKKDEEAETPDVPTLCQHVNSTYAAFEEKKCSGTYFFNVVEGAVGAECEQKVEGCSEADRRSIEKHLDCMDALPACKSESKDAFEEGVRDCVPMVGKACLDSISGN